MAPVDGLYPHFDGRSHLVAVQRAHLLFLGRFFSPIGSTLVKFLLLLVTWFLLLAVAWPLALLVLVLTPLVWLVALPFRLAALVFEALLALLRALLFLPARVLGYRG